MKPILLKIEGLNSYEKEVEIDFMKLSAGGLFGIFGPTGSGKTTIIDAVTMCLYGEMSRYNGSKGKQCINTNCMSMSLYLKFVLNEKYYSITRTYKKHNDTIKPVLVRFSRIEDVQEVIIADSTEKANRQIENLIGLSYKDFCKSVILPQGKFSDFLLLKDSDRSNMLERIFRLEKYGDNLIRKISEKNKKYNEERMYFENKLLELGDVSKKEILQKENKLKDCNALLLVLKQELQVQEELNEEYIQVKNTYDEYKKYKQKQADIYEEESKYLDNKELLDKSIKADLVNTVYKNYNDTNSNLLNIKAKLLEETDNLEKVQQQELISKKEFSNIESIKEKKYAYLIKKEADLNRAILLEKQLNNLNLEIEILQQRYKSYKNDFDIVDLSIQNLKQEKVMKSEQIEKLDELKQVLHTPHDIKKSGFEANEFYKKKTELKDNIAKKMTELSNINNRILNDIQNRQLNYKKYSQYERKLEHNKASLRDLINNMPIDRESLVELKVEYTKKQNIFNIKKENSMLADNYNLSLNGIVNKINDLNIKLNGLKQNKLCAEEQLSNLNLETEQIKNKNLASQIAKTLKENCSCPVCGSLIHPDPAQDVEDTNLKSAEDKKQKLNENILRLNKQIETCSGELILNEKEKSIIENKINELNNITGDFILEAESIKLKNELGYFENANKSLTIWEENKIELERLIDENSKILSEFKVKEAAFEERNSNDLKLRKQLEEEIEAFETEKNLSDIRLSELKRIINTSDFAGFYEKINENEIKLSKILQQEKTLTNELKHIDECLTEQVNRFNDIKSKIQEVKTIGREKRNLIQKLKLDISEVSEDKPVKVFLAEVLNEIKYIDTNYSLYKKQLEHISEIKRKCNEKKIGLLTEVKTLEDLNNKNKNKLNEALNENGFKNIDSFLVCVISNKEQEQMIEKIKIYEDRKKEILTNVQRLTEKLENYDLNKIDIIAYNVKQKLLNLRNEIESINEVVIKTEFELQAMKVNLHKTKELKLKINDLNKQIDLMVCMLKLFRGNAFVKFVSEKQLSYITIEASNRLKVMTSGRYAIELKDNDFLIRDDYNGGMLRSPKTLSGGEIFVVSLCLALSLSSNIQLRNSASLEFFFLDEGFGTLDENLIDDTVDCLELLKFEKITVGIISHVKELKERIAHKLIIEPSDGNHGSTAVLDV